MLIYLGPTASESFSSIPTAYMPKSRPTAPLMTMPQTLEPSLQILSPPILTNSFGDCSWCLEAE